MYRTTTASSNLVMNGVRTQLLLGLMTFIILFLGMKQGHAAFGLDFKTNPGMYDGARYFDSAGFTGLCGSGNTVCGISGLASATALDSTTDWIYESYKDPGTGYEYYHMIVGTLDPTVEAVDGNGRMIGFYQDVYIRMGGQQDYMQTVGYDVHEVWDSVASSFGSLSDSGGFPTGLRGRNGFGWNQGTQTYSAYPAGNSPEIDMVGNPKTCEPYMGNGCDPLRADADWSGSATGNPEKVVMRQINNDGAGFYTEFLKDVEANKPRITQEVTDGDVTIEFQADMRSVSYNDDTTTLAASSVMGTADAFVNKLTIASVTEGTANFDYASGAGAGWSALTASYSNGTQAGKTSVTAGRYTWSPGPLAKATPSNGIEYGWVNVADDPSTTYEATYYASDPNYIDSDFHDVPLYNKGSYAYVNGGSFDHLNVDWKFFLDPTENPCGGDPFC